MTGPQNAPRETGQPADCFRALNPFAPVFPPAKQGPVSRNGVLSSAGAGTALQKNPLPLSDFPFPGHTERLKGGPLTDNCPQIQKTFPHLSGTDTIPLDQIPQIRYTFLKEQLRGKTP